MLRTKQQLFVEVVNRSGLGIFKERGNAQLTVAEFNKKAALAAELIQAEKLP